MEVAGKQYWTRQIACSDQVRALFQIQRVMGTQGQLNDGERKLMKKAVMPKVSFGSLTARNSQMT